jgi:hypothetical protein
MYVPEGYYSKATSESFNGSEKVEIFHSDVHGDYLVVVGADDEADQQGLFFNKTQLQLIVHAGKDVLDDEAV